MIVNDRGVMDGFDKILHVPVVCSVRGAGGEGDSTFRLG